MIKTKHVISIMLLSILFMSCQNDKSNSRLLQSSKELTQLTELGTVEYVVTKMIKADDNTDWYKIGDRKILFSCKAYLKAGIDMSRFGEKNIEINTVDSTITVTLPKPTLISFNMKPEDIQLVYEKKAITRFAFTNAERDVIMSQGEKSIKDDVPNIGILADAETSARDFLQAMLAQAKFKNITINFSDTI